MQAPTLDRLRSESCRPAFGQLETQAHLMIGADPYSLIIAKSPLFHIEETCAEPGGLNSNFKRLFGVRN